MTTAEKPADCDARSNCPTWRSAPLVSAGLLAGSLDLIFAMTMWAFFDVSPITVLHTIASGMFGTAAYSGGILTAGLGLLLHFGIVFIMVLAYFRGAPARLRTHPWLGGLAYGALLWAVMNLVVVPASAAPVGLPPLPIMLADIAAHMILVGLPIAWGAVLRERYRKHV